MPIAPTTASFPFLQARNLSGRTFTLPAEFGGTCNIAVIAFQRWHQELVDSWFPYLEPLMAAHPDLRAYEQPMIGGLYRLARPFIDGGMAAAIPDPAVRERTLTVYTDVRRAMAALQIPSTATITLLLVARSGHIFWRGGDAYDAEPSRAAASNQRDRRQQVVHYGWPGSSSLGSGSTTVADSATRRRGRAASGRREAPCQVSRRPHRGE